MATLYLNNTPYYTSLSSKCSTSQNIDLYTKFSTTSRTTTNRKPRLITKRRSCSIRAIGTVPERDQPIEEEDLEEDDGPPCIGFGFVSESASVTPRWNSGFAYKNIDGWTKTKARPLLNCAGGGTCGSWMVEVVEGKELLSRKTDNENEHVKKNPKNWRLACETTVGTPDSRGMVVIQQLPEWKAHEWNYGKNMANISDE